ncbi:MAG TPA: hypothetical protein DD381_10940 [Lentisphaeria bacterium]|nr:MAG: hypothetical protein A2X47_00660 [Lentisphaerae bacterium GWF2_38_69]HBM16843.1 hypothetical protein [Lentisphaeria bacterium]
MRLLKYFSLIEMTLGISILVVGATSALSLIPVGIKDSNESTGKNYASVSSQSIYSYILGQAERSAASFSDLKNSIPTEYPTNSLAYDDSFTSLGNNIYQSGNIYAVKYYTGNRLDFNAEVKIWQTPVYYTYRNLNGTNVPSFSGVTDAQISDPEPDPTPAPDLVITNTRDATFNFLIYLKTLDGTPSWSQLSLTTSDTSTYFIPANAQTYDNVTSVSYKFDPGSGFTYGGSTYGTMVLNSTEPIEMDTGNNGFTYFPNSSDWGIFLIYLGFMPPDWSGASLSLYVNNNGPGLGTGYNPPAQVVYSGNGNIYDKSLYSESPGTGIGINVEVSWPIEKVYEQRLKYKYYFEVYKP